ncbi:hypothetical protein [Deinococcus pimensis]|uniref:hypothetical protein n=1 Tax=Deinococcus pimensis TaxID=309888 RepID=UPI00047FE2FD|nr:hypothetical protein [Deinococcus pimensis]
MRFSRGVTLSCLFTLTTALAILPQLEPDRSVTCATSPQDTPCRAPSLSKADQARLMQASGGRVLAYREALWTPSTREYKLTGRGATLYVTVTRAGDGPWQVTRAARTPEPRALVSAGELRGGAPVAVRASGFPPHTRVVARVGVPGQGAGPVLSGGVVGADGTVTLTLVMPGVWSQLGLTRTGAVPSSSAQDRLITESHLVVLVGTPDGRVKALTPPLPFRTFASERDLTEQHDGQLRFRTLRGATVRESPGHVEVLEVNAYDAVTVFDARRVPRRSDGPTDDAAYARALVSLHEDVLRPFPQGEMTVEGALDTPGGQAWRLLVRSDDQSRPVYVLFQGTDVWVMQTNPAHAALLDAMMGTLSVR